MSDTSDALTQARAEAAAWQERIQELEAQVVHSEPAADPYQPNERIAGPPPKELAQQIYERSISSGMRDEDITARVFSAYAQRAHAGDPRYVVGPQGQHYQGDLD